jgi:hypothetical protein
MIAHPDKISDLLLWPLSTRALVRYLYADVFVRLRGASVAIRVCPQCLKKVPADPVVAYTDKLVCPHCQSPITVGFPSRFIGGFIALGVGWLVWIFSRNNISGEAGWVVPTVYTFLAYSFTYTLYLMATADLVRRPEDAEPAPIAHDSHGHTASHH